MSLFRKPDAPNNLTFMLRGEPGTGKTRFALGVKRLREGKPVAYIGTDRGAKFYANDKDLGGFLHVETRDHKSIEEAIAELATTEAAAFSGVVVDTVTDMWSAEQKNPKYAKAGRDGHPVIPLRAWKPMRDEHEEKLRRLQALPVPVVLICEEKPIYEKTTHKVKAADGTDHDEVELKEVGSREDADKKDAYVSDIRLRFFVRESRFFAEVLKDRTGTFAMGTLIENPSVDHWSGALQRAALSAEANAEAVAAATKIADGMIERIAAIEHPKEGENWRKKHRDAVNALDRVNKARVIEAFGARMDVLEAPGMAGDAPKGEAAR